MSQEEDNKTADRWQKDADGILIFVSSSYYLPHLSVVTNVNIVDRFILCCRCGIARSVNSRLETKSTGYLCILSRQYLSTSRRPEHISLVDPCHSSYTTPILSTEIRYLGQFTMVPELGHQSYMCTSGDIVTAVGASIPHSHSTTALESTQASTNPFVLCRWCGEVSSSFGRRDVADIAARFPVPILLRPPCFLVQHKSYHLQCNCLLGRTFWRDIWMHRVAANLQS